MTIFFQSIRRDRVKYLLGTLIATLLVYVLWGQPDESNFMQKMEDVRRAKEKGDFSKQIKLLKEIIEERKLVLGNEHLGIARLYSRLVHVVGQTYSADGYSFETEKNHIDAIEMSSEAIRIFEKQLGSDHWETGKAISQKGNLISEYHLRQQQSPSERAILYMKEGLTIVEARLGQNNPQTNLLRSLLASRYLYEGKYLEAEQAYKATIPWVDENVGSNSQRLAWHLIALSKATAAQGKFSEAFQQCERAERIYRESSLVNSKEYADMTYKKGVLALLMGELQVAEELFQSAGGLLKKSYGTEASRFKWTAYDLGFVSSISEPTPTVQKLKKIADYMEVLDSRYTAVLDEPIRERIISLEEILWIKNKAELEFKKVRASISR